MGVHTTNHLYSQIKHENSAASHPSCASVFYAIPIKCSSENQDFNEEAFVEIILLVVIAY